MARTEFAKHKNEKDQIKIEAMKAGAVRALSNYMLYESGTKDPRLGKAMNRFNADTIKGHERQIKSRNVHGGGANFTSPEGNNNR